MHTHACYCVAQKPRTIFVVSITRRKADDENIETHSCIPKNTQPWSCSVWDRLLGIVVLVVEPRSVAFGGQPAHADSGAMRRGHTEDFVEHFRMKAFAPKPCAHQCKDIPNTHHENWPGKSATRHDRG